MKDVELFVRYNTAPRISPVDLELHYDDKVAWTAIGAVTTAEAREFATHLLNVCNRIDEIKRKFEESKL